MNSENLKIRSATKNDIELIYNLINGLALYEKRPADMTGTKEMLSSCLYEKNIAKTVIAEFDGKPIGYAIYYPTFSSFSAKINAHLEDLFIKSEYRHQGLGKEFFVKLLKLIESEGYSKLEWSCLDWNVSSIEFYKKNGATQENGRVYFEFSLNK